MKLCLCVHAFSCMEFVLYALCGSREVKKPEAAEVSREGNHHTGSVWPIREFEL